MKIVCISDTHNQHLKVDLKPYYDCDTIIHAGDISGRGTAEEVNSFLIWYAALPFKNKILIAGNHDFLFERRPDLVKTFIDAYEGSITYLNDSGIEINGIKFWGSPVQPWFYNWAFNRVEETIQPHWDMIPSNTQVLITHGPLRGILDLTLEGHLTGCPALLKKIEDLKELKAHICGHIHEAYGTYTYADGVKCINASVLDRNYVMKNKPIRLDINETNVS